MSYSFERRKDERHEFREGMKVEYTLNLSEKETFEADVVNVSSTGLSLLTTDYLDIGQEIIIKDDISIPSQTAQVEWIEEVNARYYKVGLVFMK